VSMKENIVKSFDWIESEHIRASNKPEWAILLHNLAYFHACLKLRSRFPRCGWNGASTLSITSEEFLESLRVATDEYLSNRAESSKLVAGEVTKNVSLQAIKIIISEVCPTRIFSNLIRI
jgi:hypothetical protein